MKKYPTIVVSLSLTVILCSLSCPGSVRNQRQSDSFILDTINEVERSDEITLQSTIVSPL
ncbi:MAG: hypothetical protein ACOY90_08260 [Candidatus Zhuqueibacterota bacterium]